MEYLMKAGEYFAILSQVVTVAAAVAALTPTPKDDNIVGKIRSVIDVIGFNFGFAKNKK